MCRVDMVESKRGQKQQMTTSEIIYAISLYLQPRPNVLIS